MARRYENIGTYTASDNKVIYLPTKYPSVTTSSNDYYIISQVTDRLDLIATDFYGDSTLWWVIAAANGLGKGTLIVPANTKLRIPAKTDFLDQVIQTNRTR